MTEHKNVVRGVVVVSGGVAGLSAALTLARARRAVTVVDAGEPRNAPADGVHGLLALNGVRPAELLARRRNEVLGYGGEILVGDVVDVSCACHGWGVRDRRVGVLATGPMAVHKALLFRQWSSDVVVFAGDHQLEPQESAQLDALGVSVIAGSISRLEIHDGRENGVRLDDGQVVAVDVVEVSTRMVARTASFAGIGIEPTLHPAGALVESDASGKTAVPGVWVAGNASDISAHVSGATAEGTRAAQHINADLTMEYLNRAVATRADAPATEEDAR